MLSRSPSNVQRPREPPTSPSLQAIYAEIAVRSEEFASASRPGPMRPALRLQTRLMEPTPGCRDAEQRAAPDRGIDFRSGSPNGTIAWSALQMIIPVGSPRAICTGAHAGAIQCGVAQLVERVVVTHGLVQVRALPPQPAPHVVALGQITSTGCEAATGCRFHRLCGEARSAG